MKNEAQIREKLSYFNGTVNYWKHWLPGCIYTDGVKCMAEICEAHWLLDAVFSWQEESQVREDSMLRQFQLWKLVRDEEGDSAKLECLRDSNDVALTQVISFTDFPLRDIKLYLTPVRYPEGMRRFLMLPSEY